MSDDDFDAEVHPENQQLQVILAKRWWTRLIKSGVTKSTISFYDEATVDGYLTATLGEWGGYLVQVMPMVNTDRLVLVPKKQPEFIDHGWCYRKGGAAVLAALTWDPQTQAEPEGYLKAVGPPRQAGVQARDNYVPDLVQAIARKYGLDLT